MSVHNYIDQPWEISLETLTLCNARCTFCPYPTLDRKGTAMDLKLMYRLLDEMATFAHPFVISPFKVNEPFLDRRRLFPYLQKINACIPLAQLRLFTNGSTLTELMLDSIQELNNVLHLWVSLNSHDSGEYEKIMGIDFDLTAKRLDELHRRAFVGEFTHPVMLSKVTDSLTGEEAFLDYCNTRWPLFTRQIIKQDSWLGYVAPLHPSIPDTPCSRWFELSILSTGVVSLCCMDGKGEFPIGNVHDQTLLEVYNQPGYRQRRATLQSRLSVHPCNTCSY